MVPNGINSLLYGWAGPSGSTKSTNANYVVEEVSEKIDTIDGDYSGNHYVFVDGAIERKVSQMRHMVVQAALAKGYSYITDIDYYSFFGGKITC